MAAASAEASLVTMAGSGSVASSSYPEMLTGGAFHFSLTYDDSVTDGDPTTAGSFTNALTAFSVWRDPANAGSWDPSLETFSVPSLFQTESDSNWLVFSASGSGFPTLDGNPFGRILMIIPVQSASDTGSGQTLAQQLGGIPTFDPLGDQATFVEAGSGDAGWTVTAFGSAVPEPASLALTTLGGALPLAATRRRSRQ